MSKTSISDLATTSTAYGSCGLSYFIAYVQQIDWLAVLSTLMMIIGMLVDWYRKRQARKDNQATVEENLNLVRAKQDRETVLQIDYYEKQIELLREQLASMQQQNEKMVSLILNEKFVGLEK